MPGTLCPTDSLGFLGFLVLLNKEMQNTTYFRNHIASFVYLFVFIEGVLYILGKHVAVYVFLFPPH